MKQMQLPPVAEKGLNIIRRLPFTRAVSLTGSYAENRATNQSDIDFFVEITPGHLWLGRFLVTAALQIAGIRRTDHKIAGKICLNWFATHNAPALQKRRVYSELWREVKPPKAKLIIERLSAASTLENMARRLQVKRILSDRRTHQPGSQVRYSDQELGFHPPKDQHQDKKM